MEEVIHDFGTNGENAAKEPGEGLKKQNGFSIIKIKNGVKNVRGSRNTILGQGNEQVEQV